MSSTTEQNIAARYVGFANHVKALYAVVRRKRWPHITREIEIRAWGQLARQAAAERAIAYHIHNYLDMDVWQPVSWRCEMEGEVTSDIQTSGTFAPDFSVREYMNKPFAGKQV